MPPVRDRSRIAVVRRGVDSRLPHADGESGVSDERRNLWLPKNRIMKAELNGRLKLSDAVRSVCELAVSCSQNRHVVEQRATRGVFDRQAAWSEQRLVIEVT
jgi:hypothetical protein